MIFRNIQVGPIETNCYLIGDEKYGVCCIVDPGDDAQRVSEMAKAVGLKIIMILLTHGHWDHTNGVEGLLKLYPDVPVYIHPEELCTPGKDSRYTYAGAGKNQRLYGEGDELEVGELKIRVLHTPGHSRGSVVLLCEDKMIAGDTLFAGSCGRCDLYGGDLKTMYFSLHRLGHLEIDYEVYPGHGPDAKLSVECRMNPYMKRAMML